MGVLGHLLGSVFLLLLLPLLLEASVRMSRSKPSTFCERMEEPVEVECVSCPSCHFAPHPTYNTTVQYEDEPIFNREHAMCGERLVSKYSSNGSKFMITIATITPLLLAPFMVLFVQRLWRWYETVQGALEEETTSVAGRSDEILGSDQMEGRDFVAQQTCDREIEEKRYHDILRQIVFNSKVEVLLSLIAALLKQDLLKRRPELVGAQEELQAVMLPFLNSTRASISWWMALHEKLLCMVTIETIQVERSLYWYHGLRAQVYISRLQQQQNTSDHGMR